MVTGAARGIGQAIAVELARAGSDILGVDLRASDLASTADLIQTQRQHFTGYACDVSNQSGVSRLLTELAENGASPDVLVNNAGIMSSGPFVERDFAHWQRIIDVNLSGLMALTHAMLALLLEKKEGHVVNISSIAGKFGTEGVAAYGASKHGVVGFSSALREELREHNIGVSWICPSMTDTRMAEDVARHFLTPLVQPKDVARAVRLAIERNSGEVFVPRMVRFNVSILPSLAPRLARWISRTTGASRGWLEAGK